MITSTNILDQLLVLCRSHGSLEMHVSCYFFNNVLDVICAKIQQAVLYS